MSDNINEQNLWPQLTNPESSFTPAPPPPPEVSVRTMTSDVSSMAKAGGGPPEMQSVPVPKPKVIPGDTPKPDVSYDFFWVILGLVVAGVLLGAGYYFLIYLPGAPLRDEGAAAGAPVSGAPAPSPVPFVHRTFFQAPPDNVVRFVQGTAASSAGELQTYGQKLQGLLNAVDGFVIEITIEKGGAGLPLQDFLSFINAPIFSQSFLKNHFLDDYTYFVVKENTAYFPGYILRLKPNEDARFLQNETRTLEGSPSLKNLFLAVPGSQIGSFEDVLVSGEPVRLLRFSSGATLFYGWVNSRDLVISTSESGFIEAQGRL